MAGNCMDRLDTMISLFNCGCYATGDIPTLSRCEEHNGFIVVCHNQNVKHEKFVHRDMTLWQGTLLHNLRKLKAEQFSYIFGYVEHNELSASKWLTPTGWRNLRLEWMAQLKRVLAPGGYISLIFDPEVTHTVLYQAELLGMSVDIRPHTLDQFQKEPLSTHSYAFADAKVHLILYNGYREKIPKKGSAILDISGIKVSHSEKRKYKNKMLVLCAHPYQFNKIKQRLGG